jgi:hypothetical protein
MSDTIPDLGLKPIDTSTINSPHPTVNEILSEAAESSYDGLGTNAPSEIQKEESFEDRLARQDGREPDDSSISEVQANVANAEPKVVETEPDPIEEDDLLTGDSYEDRVDRLAGNNNRGYERTYGWHDDDGSITTTVYYRGNHPVAILLEDHNFGEEILVPARVIKQLAMYMNLDTPPGLELGQLTRQRS